MAKYFRDVTEALFSRVRVEDFAEEIGCSHQAIKQARMGEGTVGWRTPPPGWEKAAKKLAERQAAHFKKLAASLP